MTSAPGPGDYGKRPFEGVDIDLDFCENTHSSAPCTAARDDGNECYGTVGTCQDRPNYSKTSKRYSFCKSNGPLLRDLSRLRYLVSAALQPGRIDPRGGLGGGEQITLQFEDPPHNDIGVDPYARTRASIQGRFWPKLRARNRNYAGRPVYYRSGYVAPDGTIDLSSLRTRTYFLSSIRPKGGRCIVTARDPLARLDQLQLPVPTEVELSASMTAGQTTADVKSGQGSLLGSPPFVVSVGDELMDVGAIAGDALSSITRGTRGSTAAAHDTDDRVQLCRVYEDARVDEIWADLLEADGAGVDPAYIDSAGAADEVDLWLPSFLLTRVIRKPTNVLQLLRELMQDSASFQWYDPEAALVKFLHIHPRSPGESVPELTDGANLISGTVSVDEDSDRRVTRTVVYYGVSRWDLDVGKQAPEEPAFRRVAANIDADAEGDEEYGDTRPRTVFAAFIPEDLEVEARIMAYRSTARYRDAVDLVSFELSDKDADGVALGGGVDLTTEQLVGVDGATRTIQARVMMKRPLEDGRWGFQAEDTGFAGVRWGFYAPPGTPDYPDDDAYGHYSTAGVMADGTDGWVWI